MNHKSIRINEPESIRVNEAEKYMDKETSKELNQINKNKYTLVPAKYEGCSKG